MPMEPTPELGPAEVCKVVCAGMKHVNDPFPDAGLTRLYNWMTAMGRVSLAPPPPKAGLQGGVSLEYFLEEAAGPAIGTFMECTRFGLVGEPTVMAGTQTRGGLATQLIEVHNEQVGPAGTAEEAAMVALLAAPDAYLEDVLAATRDGQPLPAPVTLTLTLTLTLTSTLTLSLTSTLTLTPTPTPIPTLTLAPALAPALALALARTLALILTLTRSTPRGGPSCSTLW